MVLPRVKDLLRKALITDMRSLLLIVGQGYLRDS